MQAHCICMRSFHARSVLCGPGEVKMMRAAISRTDHEWATRDSGKLVIVDGIDRQMDAAAQPACMSWVPDREDRLPDAGRRGHSRFTHVGAMAATADSIRMNVDACSA